MMNTTFLSQKHILDISILRGLDTSIRPWDLKLSDHLDGFAEAIDLCTSVIAAPSEEGTNFGLSDAAYVLSNAGTLWCKRVDENGRMCQRIMHSLADFDNANKGKDVGDGDGEKVKKEIQPRKKTDHPLALLADAIKGNGSYIPKRQPRSTSSTPNNIHRCILAEMPCLTPEAYLPQVYPGSLALLECERICWYVDERGNKGRDWAEFRSNTIKLNEYGYHPFVGLDVPHQNGDARTGNGIHDITGVNGDGGMLNGMENDEDVGMIMDVNRPPEMTAVIVQHQKSPHFGLSDNVDDGKSIPIASTSNMVDGLPFRKSLFIATLRHERELNVDAKLVDVVREDNPFHRRKKRVMISKESPVVSGEVMFFMHYWNIITPDHQPNLLLNAVVNRFRWRLKEVEVPQQQKGRGRMKLEKTMTFISTDGQGQRNGTEITETTRKSSLEHAIIYDDMQNGRHEDENMDADNYIELEEPAGGEEALQFDAETDFFAQIIKDPRRRLSVFPTAASIIHGMPAEESYDADSSFQVPVDLNEWEVKLTEFLKTHETSTCNFNLDTYGLDMVNQAVRQSSKPGMDVRVISDIIAAKQSSSEVCRAFLSILDLANKNIVRITASQDVCGAESRDFQHVGLTMRTDATALNQYRSP